MQCKDHALTVNKQFKRFNVFPVKRNIINTGFKFIYIQFKTYLSCFHLFLHHRSSVNIHDDYPSNPMAIGHRESCGFIGRVWSDTNCGITRSIAGLCHHLLCPTNTLVVVIIAIKTSLRQQCPCCVNSLASSAHTLVGYGFDGWSSVSS